MEATTITEILKKKYIDPLEDVPKKNFKDRTVEKSITGDRVKGMIDFTARPSEASVIRKIPGTRRSCLLKKITAGQSVIEYFTSTHTDTQQQTSIHITGSPLSVEEKPTQRNKSTNGLIYLGRLPECKNLKMWLKPV